MLPQFYDLAILNRMIRHAVLEISIDGRVIFRIKIADPLTVMVVAVRQHVFPDFTQKRYPSVTDNLEEALFSLRVTQIAKIKKTLPAHREPRDLVYEHRDWCDARILSDQQFPLISVNIQEQVLVKFAVVKDRTFLKLFLFPIISSVEMEGICFGERSPEQGGRTFWQAGKGKRLGVKSRPRHQNHDKYDSPY